MTRCRYFVLGAAGAVVDSVGGVSAAGATRGSVAKGLHRRIAARERIFFSFCGRLVILLSLVCSTAAGVLHHSCLTGRRAAVGGWLAREAAADAGDAVHRAGRHSSLVLMCGSCQRSNWAGAVVASTSAACRVWNLAELLKKNPQDYDFSLGAMCSTLHRRLWSVPWAAAWGVVVASVRHYVELVDAAAGADRLGQRGVVVDDGRPADVRAHFFCALLADSLVVQSGGRD